MNKTFISNSVAETMKFGRQLVETVPSGTTILMMGDLGAGKTTLTRGIAEALNINEKIQSPTFNIMKIYTKGDKPLIHIDAYRLKGLNHDIGLDEYIGYEKGLTVIEWPEFIEDLIPAHHIEITINHMGGDQRKISIKEVGGEK